MTPALRAGLALAVLAVGGPAAAQPGATLPRPVRYAAAFDTAVAAIARTWVDTAFLATRWLPAARAARDSAIAAPTDRAFRGILRGMLDRIPASHFYLLPAPDSALSREGSAAATPGRSGLVLRLTEVRGAPQLVVARVDTGSAAARAGVRAGDLVRRIDGHPVARALRDLPPIGQPGAAAARTQLVQAVNAALGGAAGERHVLDVVSPWTARTTVARRFVLDAETRPLRAFGNLPPMPVEVSARTLAIGTGTAAVVRFDAFLPALMPQLDEALFAARSCSALVLDLRGNPGGLVGMIGGIAGHLLPTSDTLAVLAMRESALRLVANPRTVDRRGEAVDVFAGPVMLLVDEASASASEILAGALQALGRAQIVGTRSAGMALPAQMRRLPTGDVLVHATADLIGPRGQRVEGDGVTPDLVAPLDPSRLAAGDDPALAAALDALRAHPAMRPAGATCRS